MNSALAANTPFAPVFISGSIAFDTIMVFAGEFKDHILPEQTHRINVSFLVPQMKREFGGTAANIAYNLKMLGGTPLVLGALGKDGGDYIRRFESLGIDTRGMVRADDHYTAQAFITTDLAANQITAFHPGAMGRAHEAQLTAFGASAQPGSWGLVSPNGKQAMLDHAQAYRAAGIPFIFDPGQAMPIFDGAELSALIDQAGAVAVNDYEVSMLTQKTGLTEAQIAQRVQALIITRGGEGCTVLSAGTRSDLAACKIIEAVDPTGCGDAFRAGLCHGLTQGWSWVKAAQLGSVLGAVKIEHGGPQNHHFTPTHIAQRLAENYGTA